MTKHDIVLNAFRTCITDTCKGCRWTGCRKEDILVEVPNDLAQAVIQVVQELTTQHKQEPRLLTKKDFENNPLLDYRGALSVWIEHKYPVAYGGAGYWGSWTVDEFDIYDTIRPWTSLPTVDQMEAVKWE